LKIAEEDWQRVEYIDHDGHTITKNQEVAEICFIPESKKNCKIDSEKF